MILNAYEILSVITTAKAPENIMIQVKNQSYNECVECNMNPKEENEEKQEVVQFKATASSLAASAPRLWLISPIASRELFRAYNLWISTLR